MALHSLEQLPNNLSADVLCPDVDRGTPACNMLRHAIEGTRRMLLLDELPADRSAWLVLRDIPGLGLTLRQSLENFDLPITLGITVFATICVIVINLVVDIIYAFIDPRIKLA